MMIYVILGLHNMAVQFNGTHNDAFSLLELLMLREGYMSLSSFLSKDDINSMISFVSIN